LPALSPTCAPEPAPDGPASLASVDRLALPSRSVDIEGNFYNETEQLKLKQESVKK